MNYDRGSILRRTLTVLAILSDGFFHDSRDLQLAIGVSRRTMIRVIQTIESCGFCLEYGRVDDNGSGPRTYRLTRPIQAQAILKRQSS